MTLREHFDLSKAINDLINLLKQVKVTVVIFTTISFYNYVC